MNQSINAFLDRKFPHRAKFWQLRTGTLKFESRPKLMGIVNVTPDSFSDGGRFFSTEAAVDHALRLVEDGADILDIGGESTRPYADVVSEKEEIARVIPVIESIVKQTDIPVSIDTSKAKVAEEAICAGAQIINDVTGVEGDKKMLQVALQFQPGICAMHMQGTPQTMQDNPRYDNVVEDIFDYLRRRRDFLKDAGLSPTRICLDPGIGFGKTHQHNLTLTAKCGRFHELACPILVGHSRKGFIAKILGNKNTDRTVATVGASMVLAQNAIQIIRIHDVQAHVQAFDLFSACGGIDGQPKQID